MEQAIAAERIGFAAQVGPDVLRIPAEPARLRQAAQQLGELADALAEAGQQLAGSEDRHQDQGRTSTTVLKVARWNGRRLTQDAGLLRELGEATQQAAQVVGDVQGQDLPRLRQRWTQAQDQLLAELRAARTPEQPQGGQQGGQQGGGHGGGHGGGGQHGDRHGDRQGRQDRRSGEAHGEAYVAAEPAPQAPAGPPPHVLLEHLDEQLVRPYEGLFRELFGRHVSLAGGGGGEPQASLVDARTEHAMTSYRQTVRGVLEEFAHLAQRVQQTATQVEQHAEFPARDKADDEAAAVGQAVAASVVSGLPVLRELVTELRQGAQAYDRADHAVPAIAAALRDGMLPDHQRGGDDGAGADRANGFRQSWQQHCQRRTTRLRTVAERVDDVMDKLARIDEECAEAIRAH